MVVSNKSQISQIFQFYFENKTANKTTSSTNNNTSKIGPATLTPNLEALIWKKQTETKQ